MIWTVSARMRALALATAVAALAYAAPVAASQVTINFDDISADYFANIPNGYGGLNWNNFAAWNGDEVGTLFGPSGYSTGTVSHPNVASTTDLDLDGNADPGGFSIAAGTFSLISFDLTSVFNDGEQVLIVGKDGAVTVASTTRTINSEGPTLELFNAAWATLTEVDISIVADGTPNPDFAGTGSGDFFAMDDLTVAVPEPASLAILGGALAALGLLRRRRRDA